MCGMEVYNAFIALINAFAVHPLSLSVENSDYTPSKILLYICIPEARFVGVIVTW
jgi:hypothetical protein